MKGLTLKVFILSMITILTACNSSDDVITSPDPDAEVQYRVVFQANWDSMSFPTNYPSSAHFSGLVGSTHNSNVTFWSPGSSSSTGIKSMAETGKKASLISEVQAAIDNGTAEYLISGDGIATGTGSVTVEFSLNQTHSLVTLVSMIAPSPDWFVGVHNLDLFDTSNNDWVQSKTVNLESYDAGTDSGTTFTSANSATTPQGTIELLTTDPADTDFVNGVQSTTMETIGTFTFTRID